MPGPRIVKPRTAKQRAHARVAFKSGRATRYVVPPASSAPATSWWTGVSRDELRAKATEEQARMASSRFGRLLGSGVLSE
jgi:hypothetical protein